MAESEQNTLPKTRLIRLKEVQHRVGLGRSTIYRWMAEGEFPKPVSPGGHAVAWVESEVEDWIGTKLSNVGSRAGKVEIEKPTARNKDRPAGW